MAEKELLLHCCCAPCFIVPLYKLRAEGKKISAFWYNPNIHPLEEYQKRRNTLRDFTLKENIELIEKDEYGLINFLQATLKDIENRCLYCYETRLNATAKIAKELGYTAFGTTLLYSKYQKHELIVDIALKMSAKYGVDFFYEDWRCLWWEGKKLAKETGLYRQQYCGCIFSEEERYREQIQRDKP
ncbi:MAG TPA: epoxyqueuosine reductase QueH [Candidatus Cloacimonas sp.]|nr:epoxyqueuosine reductase QueH [Candidatus Cloacimonas sp.]